jgi:hypothetical protein
MSNNETEKLTFAITTAESEKAGPGQWNNVQTYNSSDEALMALSEQKEGVKSGSCFFPGLLTDKTRKTGNIYSIGILVIDIDSGHNQGIAFDACFFSGYKCAVISTFSHMKVQTTASLSAYEKSGLPPSEYLIQKMQYLPEIAEGAEVVSRNDKFVTFKHEPCPRWRILFPLAETWRRTDYNTDDEAKIAWSQWVERVIYHLHLDGIDKCTCDLNRMFFFARYTVGGPQPVKEFFDGPLLDPLKLPDPPHAQKKQRKKLRRKTAQGDSLP